ncbi:uncharacterized protein F54H12.2-like [Panonychus citri]|uniref:uncharacterized protein F54H12.2-like n=1 Tax=Panonychus citri TaxID=50023 RepID=UPI002307D563|nr:uncharacterized protein F54H12.2-like [Panonychus citri]
MEYLHESSMPASKSELQVFSIPPTQTAIESSYEVEYRPNASLESSNFYEINVPASEDFTDLACTMLHIHLSVKTVAGASPDGFSLIKYDAADTAKYEIKFEKFSLHIKRVKLFPEAQKSIIAGLEKGPAKYFITRNDTRVFSIPSGQSSASIENVYHGVLPRRILIGLVKDAAQEESIYLDPFEFKHFNTNFISLNVDGNMIPSIPYSPNFSSNYYMREFINLYRFFGQDEGIPQLNITYDEYGKSSTLFAFDLSPDGSIGAENGTLSLIKRGNIRLDIKFSDRLKQSLKVIVFAQFDNLITIDKDRNVNLDY